MSSPALHIALILSPFLAVLLAAWLAARRPRALVLLALIPAVQTAYFAYAYVHLTAEGPFTISAPWAPALNLSLSFRFDGLSTLFAILITAVGTLIVLYAASYLEHHPYAGRFHALLFAFMGSMLGLVLTDNVFALFAFWELTGFTSYLLIGFEHDRPDARRAATQALIVTAGGGLALLAAGIVLVHARGTASLSGLARSGSLAGDPLYPGLVLLLLLAAFTKSAQFPFHFWLPNAMQAPTPASAYLHSATMVKAGVYLIARMSPIAGGSTTWSVTIAVFAGLTIIVGAVRAMLEHDLKRVLAYSTVSALGVMMLLFGIGTAEAVTAALAYLIAHACYKGALFLVAGAVEHETGTRDVRSLGGLHRAMPATALAAALAAASMAGIPLFAGFIAKEQFYEAVRLSAFPGSWGGVLLVVAVVASMCLGAAGLLSGFAPFVGRSVPIPAARDASRLMRLGPLALGGAGLFLGIVPGVASVPISLAAADITGRTSSMTLRAVAWPHGCAAAQRPHARRLDRAVFVPRARVETRLAHGTPRRAHLLRYAPGARRAKPPPRTSPAERVGAFVRTDRPRHRPGLGHRRNDGIGRGAADAETMDTSRVSRGGPHDADRRRARCPRCSPDRIWPRCSRLVRSAMRSPCCTPCSAHRISR